MKKVASRAELDTLTGRKGHVSGGHAAPSQSAHRTEPDPNIVAMQSQVAAIASAVVEIAAAVHAQAEAHAARPNALEATIHRDGKGLAQKIIITRAM